MRKYSGKIIFATHDELGPIEVVQNGFERSLHFGTSPKQSSMSLTDPLRLQLSYTRAMLAPMLFQSHAPKRILIVGLGGGSLAKFFLQHFPRCQVDAVELRAAVAEVAHDHFHLPRTPRLRVTIDDAAGFMANADMARHGTYNLILVDAFAPSGIAQSVCGLPFFESCRLRLADGGMLAVNLWSRDSVDLEEMLETVHDGMEGPVLGLPVSGKDNIIALAGGRPLARNLRPLGERARILGARHEIEFSALLKNLRKHNPLLL